VYAVVRRYTSPTDLAETIAQKRADLEQTLRGVPSFVASYLVNAGDAVATVTVCQDGAGAEHSIAVAAEWVRRHLPDADRPRSSRPVRPGPAPRGVAIHPE